MIERFLSDTKAYCAQAGIKPATLGHYAVGDNTLFRRLESGGQCLPRTMDRVRKYMADHPASPSTLTPEPPAEDAA